MVPRARNGRYGGLGTRTARVPGRWVRWIGWIGVWDAGRDLCGVDHLRHAQGYVPTATENGWAGRGDIHTNAIRPHCTQTTRGLLSTVYTRALSLSVSARLSRVYLDSRL